MAEATSLDITAAEIRQRLVSLTAIEASDTVLTSASMKLAADAWAGRILTNNSTSVASLSADQAALLKAAKIAFVCMRVVTDVNKESYSEGLIKGEAISARDKVELNKVLEKEIKDLLNVAGLYETSWYVGHAGGDDYHPSGDDYSQVDFSQTEEGGEDDAFRMFP